MGNKKEKAYKKPTQTTINKYKSLCSQMSTSQCQKILKHLIRYGRITSMQAFEKYGCTRLSARIADLKAMGVDIETQMIYKKNADGEHIHYGVYRIV